MTKKFMDAIVAMVMVTIVCITCGCGENGTPVGNGGGTWFKHDGMAINLAQIKQITTHMHFSIEELDGEYITSDNVKEWFEFDGEITEGNIEIIRHKIRTFDASGKMPPNHNSFGASITFDGKTMSLTDPNKPSKTLSNPYDQKQVLTWKEMESMIDSWLRVVREMHSKLKFLPYIKHKGMMLNIGNVKTIKSLMMFGLWQTKQYPGERNPREEPIGDIHVHKVPITKGNIEKVKEGVRLLRKQQEQTDIQLSKYLKFWAIITIDDIKIELPDESSEWNWDSLPDIVDGWLRSYAEIEKYIQ